MKRQSVLDLKQEILQVVTPAAPYRAGTQAETLVNPDANSRLAVGYSKRGKGNYSLELRVQRGAGTAHRRAKEFKGRAHGEANIAIVPRIEIPSRGALQDSATPQPRLTNRTRPLHIGLSIGHRDGGPARWAPLW